MRGKAALESTAIRISCRERVNVDGFLQSIAYMNDITIQVAVSSVFNNTVKLYKSVQLFHKNPNNVTSMISHLPVNDSSMRILTTTESSIGSKFSS